MGILVNLVMLNMLLAIIMDVYTEVKGSTFRAITMWGQIAKSVSDTIDIWKGRRIPIKRILKIMDPTDLSDEADDDGIPDEMILNIQVLRTMVAGLRKGQAAKILENAKAAADHEEMTGLSMAEATLKIYSIDERLKDLINAATPAPQPAPVKIP